MESIALLDSEGRFVWCDDHAPWGFCRNLIMGTKAWDWVTSDNIDTVKTAYSRCIVMGEPQRFQAEVTIDNRSVDMDIWLHHAQLDEVRIVATGIRLPSRIRLLTDAEKEVLKLSGEGMAPKAIAEQLEIERSTIDTHRRNIMKKLRIDNAHELQAFAVRKRQLW